MRKKAKKSRNHNVRLLRGRRSYTIGELAELFQVHIRTVQNWHKLGMTPINPEDKPWLFMGSEVRRFLSQRQNSQKCPLKHDEFYCPRCRMGRNSDPADVYIVDTGRKMGKADSQVEIKGVCLVCGCGLTRFSTRCKVAESVWVRIIRQGRARLCQDRSATVNTDLEGGRLSEC